jgi:hypothetical protein
MPVACRKSAAQLDICRVACRGGQGCTGCLASHANTSTPHLPKQALLPVLVATGCRVGSQTGWSQSRRSSLWVVHVHSRRSSGVSPCSTPLERTGWWPTTSFQPAVDSASALSSSARAAIHDCSLMPPVWRSQARDEQRAFMNKQSKSRCGVQQCEDSAAGRQAGRAETRLGHVARWCRDMSWRCGSMVLGYV